MYKRQTEGGAKIEGAKVMTLKEVIDSCTKEIDFEKLLQEVPLAFTEEERQDIINEIKDCLLYTSRCV